MRHPAPAAITTLAALASANAAHAGGGGLEGLSGADGEGRGVNDDTWISVGIAAAALPSYEGGDETVITPVPVVQAKLGPVRINPRPADVAFDFLPKPKEGSVPAECGIVR